MQLQICSSLDNEVTYKIINAYSNEELAENTLSKSQKLYTYFINNNLMETELKIIGQVSDTIFAKHIGLNNYQIHTQTYRASFEQNQNIVVIDKPILNEEFRITVLVGEKGRFKDYSLCTFAKKTEDQYKNLADYVGSFTSISSNIITHFIDFSSFGYSIGQEFDLLVYAVQVNNAKLEFLYDVITSNVGKIGGVVKIEGIIPGKNDYFTQVFIKNTTSNYLYYNYGRNPNGFVSSLKIKQESDSEEGMRITKVGCTFVRTDANDEEMVRAVNNAMNLGTSICVGEAQKDTNGFDALVNAKELSSGSSNRRLVIQVIYGLGDEEKENKKFKDEDEPITLNATLRINGFSVENPDFGYNE